MPQSREFAWKRPGFSDSALATYAAYREVSDGYVRKVTSVIPGAGASQVIIVALCCLQLEDGSNPFASPLWLASMSALINAVGGFGFGLADIDDMPMPCASDLDPLLTTAHVAAPAAIRTTAARAAIQRGRRNLAHRGPGRPAGG